MGVPPTAEGQTAVLAPERAAAEERRPSALSSWNWADLAVVPVVLLISAAALVWFARNHRVYVDDGLYLLQGSNLVSGRGLTIFGGETETVRGPVFPTLIGLLTLVFDRDVDAPGLVVRALAVANPLLVHLLLRRLAGPVAGLLAAACVAGFGYIAALNQTLNVDAPMLTLLLGSVLLMLYPGKRSGRSALLSGLLLGTAILTKETALALLPAALAAGAFLGWTRRSVALHYAGVAALCAPWWVWVLLSSGEVYLVGRLSGPMIAVAALACASAAGAVAVMARRGTLTRRLSRPRDRELAAWIAIGAWVLVLSALLLSTSEKLGALSPGSALSYLDRRVFPVTPLYRLLPFAALYVLWRALRGSRPWRFYLALMVLQVPVGLLLLAERYTLARQWLVLETLLYGALAALAVELARGALGTKAWGLRRAAYAVGLAVIVLAAVPTAAVRADFLLSYRDPPQGANVDNQLNRAVLDMRDFIDARLPDGEGIVSTWHYSYQLAFQTGHDQRWALLEMDCPPVPRSLVATACGDSFDIARHPPPATVWQRLSEECSGAALALPTLTGQMDRTRSRYLLMTQDRRHPGLFQTAPVLPDTGAFEVVHSSYLKSGGRHVASAGLVLLRRTSGSASPIPVQMTPLAAGRALGCAHREAGPRWREALRAKFPQGIAVQDGRLAPFVRVQVEQAFRR